VRRFPLMRVDCPCGNHGFFNTMEVAGEVGYERDPHKVPFKCRVLESTFVVSTRRVGPGISTKLARHRRA
jgi:hypothetical protein